MPVTTIISAAEVRAYNKEKCAEWLTNIGQSSTGTVEELRNRINKFSSYPKLLKRLESKANRHYQFECSLNPLVIPPVTAHWTTSEELFPIVTDDMFRQYCSFKKQGNLGQQEKAFRMLQSRKIVTVKAIGVSAKTFVKAMIKKSYGKHMRPAVISFNGIIPEKGHCGCPVGTSGLCCHILALLLFLKHYSDTKEKILELTVTQQLQKWHRRSRKGSIPMIPLKNIKLKSAKMKKRNGKFVIAPADSDDTYFKRDVSKIIENLNKKLDNEINVEKHVYKVLMKSDIGKYTSLGQHLHYRYSKETAFALSDHSYCVSPLFDSAIISEETEKLNTIEYHIERKAQPEPSPQIDKDQINVNHIMQHILNQNELPIILDKQYTVYSNITSRSNKLHISINSQLSSPHTTTINVDLCFLDGPKPFGTNYINIEQNTELWHKQRRFKVTGSRLPALLGIYGKTKFDSVWDVVLNGTREIYMGHIKNIRRGNQFENEAITHFQSLSKATIQRCGFFEHPSKKRYGASPDGLGPEGILLEVKTRAENSDAALKSLGDCPQYFMQCQLQMQCTEAEFCILQSYHPESASSHCFLIKRNNTFMTAVTEIIDSLLYHEAILTWDHNELSNLKKIGQKIVGKIPDFDDLKPLRTLIKQYSKSVPDINFVDEISFLKH